MWLDKPGEMSVNCCAVSGVGWAAAEGEAAGAAAGLMAGDGATTGLLTGLAGADGVAGAAGAAAGATVAGGGGTAVGGGAGWAHAAIAPAAVTAAIIPQYLVRSN